MLTNCRSEVNGNFISLLVRNSGLSFSLFLEEMLLLLHTPSSTVGFPTVGRSVRCSNASHAPRQVFLVDMSYIQCKIFCFPSV